MCRRRRCSRSRSRRCRASRCKAATCAGCPDRPESSGPRPPAYSRQSRPGSHAGRPADIDLPTGAWRRPTIFPTMPFCRPAARRPPIRRARAYSAPVYQPPPQRALPALGPMRGPNTTAAIMPAAVTPPATLACPLVSALDRWVSEGVQPAALHWFGAPVTEIKQISAYSCREMVGSGTSTYFRARLRQCARHRRLHVRRRPQDHGQGRLARHAGRAGLPA